MRRMRRVAAAAAAAILALCDPMMMAVEANTDTDRSTAASSDGAVPKNNNIHTRRNSIRTSPADFVRQRCGDSQQQQQQPAVWVYTGSLQDPLTGKEIASVQGLELVQGLASTTIDDSDSDSNSDSNDTNSMARFRRRCRNLQISRALTLHKSESKSESKQPTTTILSCGTMLSRKLFCYTSSSSPPSLLDRLRKRPGGPVTHIPIDQAVTLYDTAVSIVAAGGAGADAPNAADDTDTDTANNKWLLHTEWSDGTAIWSTAQLRSRNNDSVRLTDAAAAAAVRSEDDNRNERPQNYDDSNNSNTIEFNVYARPQIKPLQAKDLPAATGTTVLLDGSTTTNTITPSRSALIQFGASSTETAKFGARETYQYSTTGDDKTATTTTTTVRYTRYGEAPVWYGPGRMCQLELTGQLLSAESGDIQKHVPVAARVVKRHVPNFYATFGTATPSYSSRCLNNAVLQLRSARHDNNNNNEDDPVFRYYANALHTCLKQTDDDVEHEDGLLSTAESSTDDNNNNNNNNKMSCADFRRYYADLAVGRLVDRCFRAKDDDSQHHQPSLELLLLTSSRRSSRVQGWQQTARTCWDRMRAATSVSIGGGGSRVDDDDDEQY